MVQNLQAHGECVSRHRIPHPASCLPSQVMDEVLQALPEVEDDSDLTNTPGFYNPGDGL